MYEQTGTLVKNKFREHLRPAILTTMALSLATVLDGIIVGQFLGSSALAAIGLAAPIIYGINIIYVLFGGGGMVSASIARGRQEKDKANGLFTVSLLFGFGAMTLFLILVMLFLSPISLFLAGGDAETAALAADFIRPTLFVGPLLLLSSGTALFMRADGSPKSSAMIVILSNAVDLILDYIFVGVMDTGIMGAGLSTALGYAAGVLIVLPYLLNIRKKRTFRFVRPTPLFATVKDVVTTGAPRGLTHVASFARSMILNSVIVAFLGTPGMTVMTVLVNALTMVGIFVSGTGDTLLPIVGTLYGEGDTYGIKKTVESARKLLIVATIGLMAFFLLVPQVMGFIFGIKDPTELAMLSRALRMFAFYIPFYATLITLQHFYNTTKQTKLASLIAGLDGFVFVVFFAVLLAFVYAEWIWICYALSAAATLFTVVLISGRIRRKEKVKGLLLLREDEEDVKTWNMTIKTSEEDAVGLSEKAVAFCREHGLDETNANHLGLAIEEMAVASIQYAHAGKTGEIDIMVRASREEILIRFRDNGTAFDPVAYKSEDDGLLTDGVALVKAIAKEVDYTRQLGFNLTVIRFARV